MKAGEIRDCLLAYREAITAYADLEAEVEAFVAAADGVPVLRHPQKRLAAAQLGLEKIGEGLAVLPELVLQLRAERHLIRRLRAQAEEAGLPVLRRLEEE